MDVNNSQASPPGSSCSGTPSEHGMETGLLAGLLPKSPEVKTVAKQPDDFFVRTASPPVGATSEMTLPARIPSQAESSTAAEREARDIKKGRMMTLLLQSWPGPWGKWPRDLAWEIGYHISAFVGDVSEGPCMALFAEIRENFLSQDLCGGPPDAWFTDWFGSHEQRRRAVLALKGAGNPSEERPDQKFYGCKFTAYFLASATSAANLIIELGVVNAHGLVALRRLVDKMLCHPNDLNEARERYRKLCIRSSHDHNNAVASETEMQKHALYAYGQAVKQLKPILDDPFFGPAIFKVPAGKLGLKRRHQEHTITKAAGLVGLAVGLSAAMGIGLLGIMFLL